MEASRAKTKASLREVRGSFDVTVETVVATVKPGQAGDLNAVQAAFVAVADDAAGKDNGDGKYRFTVPASAMGWDKDIEFSLSVSYE